MKTLLKDAADNETEYKNAAESFRNISGYKDSDLFTLKCDEVAESKRFEEEQRVEQARIKEERRVAAKRRKEEQDHLEKQRSAELERLEVAEQRWKNRRILKIGGLAAAFFIVVLYMEQ